MDNNKKIFPCAITSIATGHCSEDCSFCTQSTKHKTDIDKFIQKPIETIIKEVEEAINSGALSFCLVSSGKKVTDRIADFVCQSAYFIKNNFNIEVHACNGIATLEQLQRIRQSGVSVYNHNLETSENYYPNICTTHTWKERWDTCQNVKEAGLKLCSGGIFGIGESKEDKRQFLESIKKLDPFAVPINFFHPNRDLSLNNSIVEIDEALDLVKEVRDRLPQVRLIIAGGREITFKNRQKDLFNIGIDGFIIGNYLTTKGQNPKDDISMINSLGLEIR